MLLLGSIRDSEGMKLGFTMFLSVYSSISDLPCVWNIYVRLLSSVLPNLRDPENPKLTHKVRLGNRTYRLENRTNPVNWVLPKVFHLTVCKAVFVNCQSYSIVR